MVVEQSAFLLTSFGLSFRVFPWQWAMQLLDAYGVLRLSENKLIEKLSENSLDPIITERFKSQVWEKIAMYRGRKTNWWVNNNKDSRDDRPRYKDIKVPQNWNRLDVYGREWTTRDHTDHSKRLLRW